MDFKTILFGFVLFSLFSFLILTAVSQQGTLYSKDMGEFSSSLDIEKFNNTIKDVKGTGETIYRVSKSQNIFSLISGIVVTTMFNIVNGLYLMVTAPFGLLGGVLINVLQIPAIVVDVMFGLLFISIMLAIWYLIKVGE